MAKSVKEREKALQEKHQAILSGLLRDEDNKYCADCHAKGPRWASWNLGVFLCIRCAGIHRNLGVHISKVKSVNLDSWTPDQMFMVQEVGNSRAMAVYEANVPDGFRRPQSDSALEIFIRDKYERKRYIAREWIPPKPPSKVEASQEEKKREKKAPSKSKSGGVQLSNVSRPKASSQTSNGILAGPGAQTNNRSTTPSAAKPAAKAAASADLLGLNVESTPAPAAPPANNDLFGDFLSADSPAPAPQTQTTPPNDKPSSDLNDANLFNEKPKSTKDSIMALFASSGTTQQFYGVPGTSGGLSPLSQRSASPVSCPPGPTTAGFGFEGGMYMGPQAPVTSPSQQQQSQPNSFMMNGSMMASQPSMMTSQPGMMASQPNMMASQPNMMASQPNMMASQPNMMASQPGVMASQPNMMTSQQGMMPGGMYQGQQPSQGGVMPNLAPQMGHPMSMNPGNMMMMNQPHQQQQAMMMNAQQNMMNPQHLQQVQHQMAAMRLSTPQTMMGAPQPGGLAAGSGWGAPPAGNTLSTNLWQ